MRYELKYRVEVLDYEAILASILMHPASFTKAFEDRQVNNIYLDSPVFQCFYQNIEGQPQRKKMRLRWYGEEALPTTGSTLEIKIKEKELGWKVSHPVQSSVEDAQSLTMAIEGLGLYQGDLTPTLLNTYYRSYYISHDGIFRITIDREQTFRLPFAGMPTLPNRLHPIIVELKYDEQYTDRAKMITDYLPFRQTKNSKYTTGIEELYF